MIDYRLKIEDDTQILPGDIIVYTHHDERFEDEESTLRVLLSSEMGVYAEYPEDGAKVWLGIDYLINCNAVIHSSYEYKYDMSSLRSGDVLGKKDASYYATPLVLERFRYSALIDGFDSGWSGLYEDCEVYQRPFVMGFDDLRKNGFYIETKEQSWDLI